MGVSNSIFRTISIRFHVRENLLVNKLTPQGNVDSDTTLTLGLQLVKHPRVLEGTLAHLGGFL